MELSAITLTLSTKQPTDCPPAEVPAGKNPLIVSHTRR